MGEQLVLEHAARSTELAARIGPAPWLPLAVAALKTATNQWSANTRIAYSAGIRSWHDWCREWGEPCELPPRIEAVVAWLHWMAEVGQFSRSTILLRLSGLAWADQWARMVPGTDVPSIVHHPLIRAWRRGHARKPSRAVCHSRALPPSRDELRSLVDGCMVQRVRTGQSRTPATSARDRAMILMLYFGAMRKSELIALRVGDVRTSPRGIEIEFCRSKTDQTGQGEIRAILPQSEAIMCAVHAWTTWIELYQPSSPECPAFVATYRGQLTSRAFSYQTVDSLLNSRCKDAGIRLISPHQLRAAFATHALERHEEGEVAYHGRWRSRSTMDRYVRRTKTWNKNPTGNLTGSGNGT